MKKKILSVLVGASQNQSCALSRSPGSGSYQTSTVQGAEPSSAGLPNRAGAGTDTQTRRNLESEANVLDVRKWAALPNKKTNSHTEKEPFSELVSESRSKFQTEFGSSHSLSGEWEKAERGQGSSSPSDGQRLEEVGCSPKHTRAVSACL